MEDTIVQGSSIHFMCDILNKMKVPFDVVSITSYKDSREIEEVRRYLGAENIYIGTTEGTGIYGSRHLGGIKKDDKQVFSRPYKQDYQSEGDKINAQEKINQARKDVDIVADHVIDWYESQKTRQ